MSSADRLLLFLHIGFAIFTLGPLTAATMATPRYIRRGDAGTVRYLNRATRVYGLATLGVFLFGALLGRDELDRAWISAAMTLFVVAFALLLIVERDQRKAVRKMGAAAGHAAERAGAAPTAPEGPEPSGDAPPEAGDRRGDDAGAEGGGPDGGAGAAPAAELAKVELGRIATISGVVALIWLVSLVLMVWNA